jgi:osmotically-inducible protein OsmY
MKKTSAITGHPLKVLALIVCVGAVPLACVVTGCTTGSRYHQSTGEYIDDHGISSDVKKALNRDTIYKYEDVNVVTFKGVVQLSGFVNTKDQKNRAGDLAKAVAGVKEVENNITVKE